jgi:hypothetical protein
MLSLLKTLSWKIKWSLGIKMELVGKAFAYARLYMGFSGVGHRVGGMELILAEEVFD